MKKKKLRLREKIKNRPKPRDSSRKKKKTMPRVSETGNFSAAPPEDVDQGMEVMSQVIVEFARPLLETCTDEASERKAISLAIFIWNATLLPEAERKRTLDGFLSECRNAMPSDEFENLSGYIDRLVENKKIRFARNRKKITNCTFGNFGEGRHIEVGYTME